MIGGSFEGYRQGVYLRSMSFSVVYHVRLPVAYDNGAPVSAPVGTLTVY
jgi:hypothetical protein